MLELMDRPELLPFMVALVLTLLFFIFELLSLMLGGGSDWADGLLPEALVDGSFGGLLNWLYVGRVPLLMVLIIFWTVFGLLGLVLQYAVFLLFGTPLPSLLATALVFALSLPLVRLLGGGLYKILPKDETSAIDSGELIGRVGTVVIGVATKDSAAQIKVKDLNGQTHYVMALADSEPLPQGQSVLLVAKKAATFTAIKNPSAILAD